MPEPNRDRKTRRARREPSHKRGNKGIKDDVNHEGSGPQRFEEWGWRVAQCSPTHSSATNGEQGPEKGGGPHRHMRGDIATSDLGMMTHSRGRYRGWCTRGCAQGRSQFFTVSQRYIAMGTYAAPPWQKCSFFAPLCGATVAIAPQSCRPCCGCTRGLLARLGFGVTVTRMIAVHRCAQLRNTVIVYDHGKCAHLKTFFSCIACLSRPMIVSQCL